MNQPVKIDAKIVGYAVVDKNRAKGEPDPEPVQPVAIQPQQVQAYERPEVVEGATYKIKPPTTGSAMYITINHIRDERGELRPIEIFVNTKHMEHFQWVAALTRMISAVLRKPGPFLFVVDELQQVFDPQGGYWEGGSLMPSVVAHIGKVFKEHCQRIGVLEAPAVSAVQRAVLEEKRAEAERRGVRGARCSKCSEDTVIKMDGCMTCTNCGDSKCG